MKTIFVWMLVLVTMSKGADIGEGEDIQTPPTCFSRFDHDYKVLLKLAKLEEGQDALQNVVENQNILIDELQERLRVSSLLYWGDWGSWSDCYMNCTGNYGGRIQHRSRQRIYEGIESETETETRPCNAVQFAGCVKDFGERDNYGVSYDYADQIAVSTCTALLPGGSNYVYAVRRTCSNFAVSCDGTCNNLGLKCFNQLHVYGPPILKRNQENALGLYAYRYNNCAGNFCGPNFCCCQK